MVVSLGAGLGLNSKADAQILAPIERAVVVAVDQAVGASPPPPQPSPSPTPTPLPTSNHALVSRGGPLQFNLAGSLSLGESSTTSTFGQTGYFTPTPGPTGSPSGPFPFQNAQTNNQNLADLGAGMTGTIERRTASTMTDVRVPFGFSSNGHSLFGVPQFLYSTPKYSLGYGVQPVLGLGQLQLGSTISGFEFIVPVKNGQATLFQGPALGVDAEVTKLYGALVQKSVGRMLYEYGLVYDTGQQTGRSKTIDFGAATAGKTLSLITEGAWQTRSDGNGTPHGIAVQSRLDDMMHNEACSLTLRSVPDQFVSFIAGEIYSDKYGDMNCHTNKIPLTFDANYEKTGDALYGVSIQSIETLGYSPSLRFGGVAFNLTRQDGSSEGEAVWSNTGSVQFQTQFFGTTALLGTQLQNSVQGLDQVTTDAFLAGLHHPIGRHLSIGIQGQVERQIENNPPTATSATPAPEIGTGFGVSHDLTKALAFNVEQSWRLTTVGLSETLTRTVSDAADSIQQTPLVTVTRQISPVISITSSIGEQILRDRLNPSSNGRSRVFSLAINAPFSFGNANVTGRVDPRLPATITGRVLYAGANAGAGAGALAGIGAFSGSGGVGNVLVTLDNKYIQRTDLTGGFQFPFLSPGQHQLTIDTSTMPRGFTAAVPVQTVTVQGGQNATVVFNIGTFGGIQGHVYGYDANGNPEPLSNVQLRVDGGAYSQTDSTGAYGFGGLSAGQHDVTIIPQSIPATAEFSTEALEQKLTVANGSYTTADFHAQILGSIAGTILYGKDMLELANTGVLNAYVVAEPGEHAAIDQDDGSFIIDNLPAGDYTISVDPETIRPDLGSAPETISVHLEPGEHYSGVLFTVGRFEKKVVFSLLSGGGAPAAPPPAVRLSEGRLPPLGTTQVSVSAPEDAKGVKIEAFGDLTALAFDKASSKWIGQVQVPLHQAAGTYTIKAIIGGSALPTGATLIVDPKLPLVTMQITSPHPAVGADVFVRARFLVDVHPGDKLSWGDGTTTVLGKPVNGRVFTFEKRLTLLPLHGELLTSRGPVPIELL